MATDDIELTSRDGRRTYTLTLDPDGGFIRDNENTQGPVRYTTKPLAIGGIGLGETVRGVPASTDVKRPGYTFQGWFKTLPGFYSKVQDYPYRRQDQIENGDQWIWNHDMTFTARWEPGVCTITFADPDGTFQEKTTSVTYGTPFGRIGFFYDKPTREGYLFTGWFTYPEGGERLTEYSQVNGSKTYYAQWEKQKFTVEFWSRGQLVGSRVVQYKDPIGTLPKLSSIGYAFDGWVKSLYDEEDGNKVKSSTLVTGDMNIYAKWTANIYSIAYNLNGHGTLPDDAAASYTILDEINPPENISDICWEFLGWIPTTIKTGTWGNKTFTARWKRKSVQAVFMGGVEGERQYDKYAGDPVGENPVATHQGKTFLGWKFPNGDDYTPDSVIYETTTFTPEWENNAYAVTLNPGKNGSVEPATLVAIYDTRFSEALPTPTRPGYTFFQWKDELGNFVGEGYVYTFPRKSVFDAAWNANNYTLAMDSNGGTDGELAIQRLTYDAPENLRKNTFVRKYTVTFDDNIDGSNSLEPMDAEYSFLGWSGASDGEKLYSDKEQVSNLATKGTVTLYALWEDGYIELPTPDTTPTTRRGYEFVGWSTTREPPKRADQLYDLTVKAEWQKNMVGVAGGSYVPTQDMTLYAMWQDNTIKVTLYINTTLEENNG